MPSRPAARLALGPPWCRPSQPPALCRWWSMRSCANPCAALPSRPRMSRCTSASRSECLRVLLQGAWPGSPHSRRPPGAAVWNICRFFSSTVLQVGRHVAQRVHVVQHRQQVPGLVDQQFTQALAGLAVPAPGSGSLRAAAQTRCWPEGALPSSRWGIRASIWLDRLVQGHQVAAPVCRQVHGAVFQALLDAVVHGLVHVHALAHGVVMTGVQGRLGRGGGFSPVGGVRSNLALAPAAAVARRGCIAARTSPKRLEPPGPRRARRQAGWRLQAQGAGPDEGFGQLAPRRQGQGQCRGGWVSCSTWIR